MRVIRRSADIEDAHAYLQHLHAGDSEEFNQMFEVYKQQYYAPIESPSPQ
ncbi:MAG: hypothetical protein LUB63_01825 [Oscillospiraceae bacterium]|nr:hypothetical protein [Oscillospiraceae bacterium]